MKDFALIFRLRNEDTEPDSEEMKDRMSSWDEWVNHIHKAGAELVSGNHMSRSEARTVDANDSITEGAYMPANEYVAGYIIIRAHSLDHAVEIARKCPILGGPGNHVEVRALATPGAD